jgi:hypothetical protein
MFFQLEIVLYMQQALWSLQIPANFFRLLVIGLGVCIEVIALVGVDRFCCSNLLDILLVIGLGAETEVIVLVGVALALLATIIIS